MPTAERGFTLLEVVVCAALVTIAAAATAGAVAAVGRAATPGVVRDAAAMVAQNALVRARAAVAYASSPTLDGSALLGDRGWALVDGGVQRFVAGALIVAPAACGDATPHLLQLPVTTTFDPSQQQFTVAVSYPRDPCATTPGDAVATLVLSERLPPSVYPPGQTLTRDVMTPARM